MSRSVKVISAIIPWAGILWAALLPGSVQAHSCVQLCDQDFWPTATAAQIRTAIANEGVTARDEDGETPLHWASRYGLPKTVSLLLAAGADIEGRNEDGETPLHSASEYGSPKTVSLLLAAGADIEARDKDDWTPLHSASRNNTPETVSLLLAAGADIKARNKDGETAFDLAKNNDAIKGTDAYRQLSDAQ